MLTKEVPFTELRVGRKYRNARGEAKEIVYQRKYTCNYPFEDRENNSYTKGGACSEASLAPGLDLIAEIIEEPETESVADTRDCPEGDYTSLPAEPKGDSPRSTLTTQVGGDHYLKMPIQPLDFILANSIGFAEGNVIKYVCRWREKNGIEDLRKAAHYLAVLIEKEEAKA